jgi:hypothetical protein
MSAYTTSYKIRYQIPTLQEQTEVAAVHAANDIVNEDPATPDHENRLTWANYCLKSSSVAWIAFSWPVALNPSIQASVEADPTGATVRDEDVQFVVNSALPEVIADYIATLPPITPTPPAV